MGKEKNNIYIRNKEDWDRTKKWIPGEIESLKGEIEFLKTLLKQTPKFDSSMKIGCMEERWGK